MAKDIRIPFVIILLSTTQLAGGITTGVLGRRAVRFSRFFDMEALITTGIWNGAGALCDLIIACCMIYFYSSRNSIWKLKPTRVPVSVKMLVQSGSLLAVIAIINTAFCFLTHGETFFESSAAILGNTYANTLLAVFNSRVRFLRPSEFVDISETDHASTYNNSHTGVPVRTELMFALPTIAAGDADTGTHVDTDGFETGVQTRRSTDTGTVVSEDLERWNEDRRYDTSKEEGGTSNPRSSIELAPV
ncbi:hypothetical protein M413DRAFT_150640 [Hebeloma cylindrosporum]|uniref:DUF6534 domain-containing protein n=1 Tax=Hebeloma cylindrosporum TaxID=76867 RepID=A0A0C3CD33_HEBCY|nr:hypothetical protein M413DRAFT_150640 [Hebeloma cylindrosporum h7]